MIEYNQTVVAQSRKTKGYLFKKSSGLIANWQRRFFIILNNALCYFEDEALEQIKKRIALTDIRYIKVVDDLQFHLVTKRRIFELKAIDEPTRDLWVASLDILIHHKEYQEQKRSVTPTPLRRTPSPRKETPTKAHHSRTTSRHKKISNRFQSSSNLRADSPPSKSRKESSIQALKWKVEYSPESFLGMVCLRELSERWQEEQIRKKVLLLKQRTGCYFIVSCKSLLTSHQDEDFLSDKLIQPYEFNCLYYLSLDNFDSPQVIQVSKCCHIQEVTVQKSRGLILTLPTRQLKIQLQNRKGETIDISNMADRLMSAREIGCQFYNSLGVKLKRNYDMFIHQYQNGQRSMLNLVQEQVERCQSESKDSNPRLQFRKTLESLRKVTREVMGCCQVKQPPSTVFLTQFVNTIHEEIYQFIEGRWSGLRSGFSVVELKKMCIILHDIWKLVRGEVTDDLMFQGSLGIQKHLINKYREEVTSKMDSCFGLEQGQIWDQVNIQAKGEGKESKQETIFLSNRIYRQFHLDVRLILHEFADMPIHESSLECYIGLVVGSFKHLADQTYRCIEKWRLPELILATCNEIQLMKKILLQEMTQTFSQQYPAQTNAIRKQALKQIDNQISNIEITLIKKLFVLTFSGIDRQVLGKAFDKFNLALICQEIIKKLETFEKINKYVRRNIFQASFEEICYFYYTLLTKYTPSPHTPNPLEQCLNKLSQDISALGQAFQNYVYEDKIYTHLKDLQLLRQFLHCDPNCLATLCKTLKKQYGNSLTEASVRSLLNLRQMPQQITQQVIAECQHILKNSAETPEDNSLMSSSRESFLQSWNNTRSRKSTLTQSINEFSANQVALYQRNKHARDHKQGFLLARQLHMTTAQETRWWFKISRGELRQYECGEEEGIGEPVHIYDLSCVKKCFLHPQRHYALVVEFPEVKLQLKAESSGEARGWVKNIYEEISSLGAFRPSRVNPNHHLYSLKTAKTIEGREGSTLDQSPLFHDLSRSKQKAPRSPTPVRNKQKTPLDRGSREGAVKVQKGKKQQQVAEESEGCLGCSKGFFL